MLGKGGNMAGKGDIVGRCPKCGAAENPYGNFERSAGKVAAAAAIPDLPRKMCGECAGCGPLYGGFPRTSRLGVMFGDK